MFFRIFEVSRFHLHHLIASSSRHPCLNKALQSHPLRVLTPPPAPPRQPVDPQVALAKMQAALDQLNAAEAAAIETNARVERAL
jgi:hypothetical protein